MTRRFHAGTQVRAIMEELGMRYTTPSSMGPDGVLTTSDVYGNEVIAKARGHVGELTGAVNQLLMLNVHNMHSHCDITTNFVSARIPEICIGRAKRFKILSNGISHQMIPLMDSILYFCIYSANFLLDED